MERVGGKRVRLLCRWCKEPVAQHDFDESKCQNYIDGKPLLMLRQPCEETKQCEVKDKLRKLLEGLTEAELKTLRSMINGKLGKRTITAEQQARMQDARKKR